MPVPTPLWLSVDRYLADHLMADDEVLTGALAASDAAGLPSIAVSPAEGKALHLLARFGAAHRILEVGTLGGYSTIWLGRALPLGGQLVTLEINPAHADVARQNIERAGLTEKVEVMVGPALHSLTQLIDEHVAPFDFIFIDADKDNCAPYFDAALALSRSGTMIVVDNVVRDGEVADASSTHPAVLGVRRLMDALTNESRVDATVLQTVGAKGYDGMLLAMVR